MQAHINACIIGSTKDKGFLPSLREYSSSGPGVCMKFCSLVWHLTLKSHGVFLEYNFMIFQAELVEILINILHYLNNPQENNGPIKYHRWIPQILPPKGRYSLQTWIENVPFRQATRCFFVKHCSKMPKYQKKNSNFRRKTILSRKISSYSLPP